ncbi:hypothetical protein [Serratia liquefaciens]|uniref:hypothetical protein n=1 Tax=Serratia liquefaciens TaxID=614 RepID=UPI002360A048|nr:hypothetical protein [Serratia liquefaciens]
MRKKILLLVSGILLSGCQSANTGSKNTVPPSLQQAKTEVAPMSLASSAAIQSCPQELIVLEKIAPKSYKRKSGELNNALAQASLYLSVKESVNPNTVEIMDSAYKYKISKICNEIQSELANALISNVENVAQPPDAPLFSANAHP